MKLFIAMGAEEKDHKNRFKTPVLENSKTSQTNSSFTVS